MFQYVVVQYTMKHQKCVAVSSFTVYDESSESWSIINLCQYLGAQYVEKHQKYVSVYSCTIHDEASEMCAII
jgi:predicted GNAT family acetyltransferase